MPNRFRSHIRPGVDVDHPEADEPACAIALRPHQRKLMRAMERLERQPVKLQESLYATSLGLLADPRGTGKTYAVLGHIANHTRGFRFARTDVATFVSGLLVRYSDVPRTIHMGRNLVVVPHKLIKQWARACGSFIHLRPLVLNSLVHWRGTDKELCEFDVVIISCKLVKKFYLRHSNVRWARVVFDEADSLEMAMCPRIDAHFYWFLTARWSCLADPLDHNVGSSYGWFWFRPIASTGFLRDVFVTLACTGPAISNPRHPLHAITLACTETLLCQSLERSPAHVVTHRVPKSLLQCTVHDVIHHPIYGNRGLNHMLHALGIHAYTLDEAIDFAKARWDCARLQDPGIASTLAQNMQGECETCLESRFGDEPGDARPIMWTCCQNVTCLDCVLRMATEPAFQVQCDRWPWRVRCPYCRTSIDLGSMAYVGELEPVREPTLSSHPVLDKLMTLIDRPGTTLVMGDLFLESFYKIPFACNERGITCEIFAGSYKQIDSMLERFRRGDLRVLVCSITTWFGFDARPDHVVCVETGLCVAEELVYMGTTGPIDHICVE